MSALSASTLRAALQQTFDFRRTHSIPPCLPDPPADWLASYARLARDPHRPLPWADLATVTAAARAFLDPVLAGDDGTWDPVTWTWLPA